MLLRHLKRLTLLRENTVFQSQFCVQLYLTPLTRSFADDINPLPKGVIYSERTPRRPSFSGPDDILSKLVAMKDEVHGFDIVHAFSAMNVFRKTHKIHKREMENLFEKLVSIVEKHKKNLTASEALKIISILQHQDYPQIQSSYTSFLIHILQHADDLNFQDCDLLMYLITRKQDKINDTSIREQVHNALVKKAETGPSTAIDLDIDYLQFALCCLIQFSNQQMYQELIKTIQEKLCSYPGKIPYRHAISIFTALATPRSLSSSSKRLLSRIQNDLMEQSSFLDRHQVRGILSAMQKTIESANRDHSFYNEKLVNALIERVIEADMGYDISIPLAVTLVYYLRHKSQELMNYCCASFFARTSHYRKILPGDMRQLVALTKVLGETNCTPVFLDEIRSYINDSREILYLSHAELINLTPSLLILNCYPTHLLKKIFDGSFKCSSDSKSCNWSFCMIYQKLKSNPSYTGPMPTECQIASLKYEMMENRKRFKLGALLLSYLNQKISDPRCIRSGITTRLFHSIDHVVAFHEDGTPAPITTESYTDDLFEDEFEYLEDLRVPPGCRMILIVVALRWWYFTNVMELSGLHNVPLDTLKQISKHPVVVINELTWADIRADEKASFLMNEIRSKLGSPVVQPKIDSS